MFELLPNEILDMILRTLSLHDIKSLQRADKSIYGLINELYGDLRPHPSVIERCLNVVKHIKHHVHYYKYIYSSGYYITGDNFIFRYFHDESSKVVATVSRYNNRTQTSCIHICGHDIITRLQN
jgi:hypothetical protein